ncbi:YkyA family protein [Oceanobacillus massiliensis]|uniref:YkyA family protein n=1 Tax=Oceanobacillus massiliensis TaxID=1465765 RepID=UPI0002881B71|nr:YkyA family protein [Oceanobacillus massiliensis]
MHLKKLSFILLITLIALLTACSSPSTEEQIHSHLEEAVNLEEGFENQQEEITDLEVQEQEIYNQIIDLGMEDFEKIKELSEQALGTIDEREEKIELERESIETSQEEFVKIEDLITELDDGTAKEKAENMYEMMNKRYTAYGQLNDAYVTSLEQERELYQMLQQEDIEQETLTEQINAINESYEKVLSSNEEFNNYTMEYNELKKEFYEVAELDVTYEQ